MGIYDRDYVRVGPQSRSGLGSVRFVSVNTWLILINVAVFVLGGLLASYAMPVFAGRELLEGAEARPLLVDETLQRGMSPTTAYRVIVDAETRQPVGRDVYTLMPVLTAIGHFSTARAFIGIEVWRFITFQFLHGGLMHLVFNMFGLWIFGGMVEQYLGSKRYLAFYLICGIFGALTYLLLNFLGEVVGLRFPGVLINDLTTPLVGASAGVFGVIIACAYIAPDAIVQLIFPPIPLKLKVMAYAYVAIAAYNLLTGGANAGGDAAHIGGAIAGFFFIRNAHLLRDFFDVFGHSGQPRAAAAPRRAADGDKRELDRILAKVSDEGLHSLSEREKQTLRRATENRRTPW